MKFKEWLLDEAVARLLHHYQKNKDAEFEYLGKFGRFKTYYVYKKDNENRKEKALDGMKLWSVDANYKLDQLGFPGQSVTTLISDRIDQESVAGRAYQSRLPIVKDNDGNIVQRAYARDVAGHGIMVKFDYIDEVFFMSVLIHEFAHAYYYTMPKVARDIFVNEYKKYERYFDEKGFNDLSNKDYNKAVDDLKKKHKYKVSFIKDHFKKLIEKNNLREFLYNNLISYYDKLDDNNFLEFIISPENKNAVVKLLHDAMMKWKDVYGSGPYNAYYMDFLRGDKLLNKIIERYKELDRLLGYHGKNISLERSQINLSFVFKDYMLDDLIEEIEIPYHVNDIDLKKELMTKKYNLPWSYSATNYHELWATVVEYAAMNLKSIDPELKKLLIQTIMMSR